MNAYIFPGQGSQKVGMGASLIESHPQAVELFERAGAVLGYDLRGLCLQGPADSLTDTRHAQPALLTVGVICHTVARAESGEATMMAGHSLGEFTALVAADALDFEEALQLVQRRANLMAAAPSGTMAAIIGLADDALEGVLKAASGAGLVVPANYNSPGQIVISGEPAAVEAAMVEAKNQKAKLAVKLPVSGAFHSPLMAEAGEQMAALIDAAPFRDAQVPVYQNTTAQPATRAADLQAALRGQMTSPVRWTETIRAMIAAGATNFQELGPGKVLTGLVGRIDKSVTAQSTDC